jgi:hypothetical protein
MIRDSISLTLTANNRSHKVKKRYKISSCRFRFGEAMLVRIMFNVMQNMIVNNTFKQLREITENITWSTAVPSGMIISFKYRYNSSFLPCSRKILLGQAQVKYMPKIGGKIRQ